MQLQLVVCECCLNSKLRCTHRQHAFVSFHGGHAHNRILAPHGQVRVDGTRSRLSACFARACLCGAMRPHSRAEVRQKQRASEAAFCPSVLPGANVVRRCMRPVCVCVYESMQFRPDHFFFSFCSSIRSCFRLHTERRPGERMNFAKTFHLPLYTYYLWCVYVRERALTFKCTSSC